MHSYLDYPENADITFLVGLLRHRSVGKNVLRSVQVMYPGDCRCYLVDVSILNSLIKSRCKPCAENVEVFAYEKGEFSITSLLECKFGKWQSCIQLIWKYEYNHNILNGSICIVIVQNMESKCIHQNEPYCPLQSIAVALYTS
jgi:hypothetical protein